MLARQKRISSDIAHDLRTPLTRLRQSLEAITDAKQSAVKEKLLSEVDGILSTFSALLRISEIEEGSRKAGFRKCDFSALLLDVAEAYSTEFGDNGQFLKLDIESGLIIKGDPDLLKQLIANCLENILLHTPPGRTAHVSIKKAAGSIILLISDNGPGMLAEDRQHAFGEGQRLRDKLNRQGHGFGLKLIKAIADLHSANIALLDAEPGLLVQIEFTVRAVAKR